MTRLAGVPTVPGVLSAQVGGIDGAAVICAQRGEPMGLTLGGSGQALTVQFDALAVRGLMSILGAALKHMEGK